MNTEPIVVINSVVAIICFLIAYILTSNGINLTDEQKNQIYIIVSTLGLLVGTFLGRSKVVPVSKLKDENYTE